MTHPAALQALSTGPDNRPFSPTRQYGNETQGFFSRLWYPEMLKRDTPNVMAALVAAIHVFRARRKTWIAAQRRP